MQDNNEWLFQVQQLQTKSSRTPEKSFFTSGLKATKPQNITDRSHAHRRTLTFWREGHTAVKMTVHIQTLDVPS